LARQNQHHPWYGWILLRGAHQSFPTLGLFLSHDIKNQVCNVGVSLRVCSINKEYQVCSCCSYHILGHRMPFVLFNLNLKWLATKNTRRCILS
jgi:hypothetical protein